MSVGWQPSEEYRTYCRRVKEGEVTTMYRCDKCGVFGDQPAPLTVHWAEVEEFGTDFAGHSHVNFVGNTIDLCGDCAPALLEQLRDIAKEEAHD